MQKEVFEVTGFIDRDGNDCDFENCTIVMTDVKDAGGDGNGLALPVAKSTFALFDIDHPRPQVGDRYMRETRIFAYEDH